VGVSQKQTLVEQDFHRPDTISVTNQQHQSTEGTACNACITVKILVQFIPKSNVQDSRCRKRNISYAAHCL